MSYKSSKKCSKVGGQEYTAEMGWFWVIGIGRSEVQAGRTGSIKKKGGQDRQLGVWDVGGRWKNRLQYDRGWQGWPHGQVIWAGTQVLGIKGSALGLMFCFRHLEILNKFIFKYVFCRSSPTMKHAHSRRYIHMYVHCHSLLPHSDSIPRAQFTDSLLRAQNSQTLFSEHRIHTAFWELWIPVDHGVGKFRALKGNIK